MGASLRRLKNLTGRQRAIALLILLVTGVASSVFAAYLNWEPEPLVRTALFALLATSVGYRALCHRRPGRVASLLFALVALLFAVSMIYGENIVVLNPYAGTVDEAYIEPLGLRDAAAYVVIACSTYALESAGFLFLARKARNQGELSRLSLERVDAHHVALLAAVLFVLWLPYLLTYWPGFIFSDSFASLDQARGLAPLSNHHPVAYTLLIKVCLFLANLIGLSNTTGVALYSAVQMIFMAGCFAFGSCWVATRVGKRLVAPCFVVLCGVTPYVATHSIAMWKDPMFSTALAAISLLLCDLMLYRRAGKTVGKSWYVAYTMLLVVMTFIRNNGFYVTLLIVASLVVILLVALRRSGRANTRTLVRSIAVTGIVAALYVVVTGPVYQLMGVVPSEKVESLGIPLNQMARVAALDGDMSDSDRAYMDELRPLEQYRSKYRPCCTDLLKWDAEFNSAPLGEDFFAHWASMLLRNPRVYFDAWVMQTFGFWTVNQVDAIGYSGNIAGGVPKNLTPEVAANKGIFPSNKLGIEAAYDLFPSDEWSIPTGILFWAIVYLSVCLLVSGAPRNLLLGLIPSWGLVATLLIASPIWYWPRYAFALQCLIPFYVVLFTCMGQGQREGRDVGVAAS